MNGLILGTATGFEVLIIVALVAVLMLDPPAARTAEVADEQLVEARPAPVAVPAEPIPAGAVLVRPFLPVPARPGRHRAALLTDDTAQMQRAELEALLADEDAPVGAR